MLGVGRLRSGAGSGHPNRGDLSGGGADVFGGGPVDCVRLRLLPALERSERYANYGMEIPQGPQRHFAEDF